MAELAVNEDALENREPSVGILRLAAPVKVDSHGRERVAFEDEICPGARMDCLDEEVLDHYSHHWNARTSTAKLLTQRGFVRDGQLTNGCVLLFAKRPADYLPCARVHLSKFQEFGQGDSKTSICVKDLILDGPLPKLFNSVEESILKLSDDMTVRDTDGSIHTVEDYPRPAWMDGLLGALMHRSYRSNSYIHITLDKDHMQILSPGTASHAEEESRRTEQNGTRNPRITAALVDMGLSYDSMSCSTSLVERVTTLESADYESQDVLDGQSVMLTLRSNLDAWSQLLKDNEVDGQMLLSPIYSL